MYYICTGVINQLNQSYNSSHHELNSERRGVAGDLYCIRSVPAKSPWLMYARIAATVSCGTRIRGGEVQPPQPHIIRTYYVVAWQFRRSSAVRV